jgi:hypothetical protein
MKKYIKPQVKTYNIDTESNLLGTSTTYNAYSSSPQLAKEHENLFVDDEEDDEDYGN